MKSSLPRGERTLAPIKTRKRKALPDSAFAIQTKRAYPVDTAARARNAMARLEQNKGALSRVEYATEKRNILRAYKRFGIKHDGKAVGTTRASIRTAGLSIHVHHMSDRDDDKRLLSAVELDASAAGDAEDAPKPTWNQLAKIGQWAGHPSGPFQITAKEIGEIVRNFKATQNRRIPIDFEHASEADPTEGTIPVEGAPAQAWIIDLEDRASAGLWGLIDWLEPARTYVRAKKYRYFSPAIRFNSKDRVTGSVVGARMTSGALTNTPFLDGMAPLMAANDKSGEPVVHLSTYAHSPDEYMPRMRACLRMAETATARECMERLAQLEELFAKTGAVEMTEGVDLGIYMHPMRDLVGAAIGCSWEDVFDTVKALIRAAIGEHNVERHGDDIDIDEEPVSSVDMRDDMATNDEMAVRLREAETKITTLAARESELTLKLAEAEAAKTRLETKNQTLEAEAAKRADTEANARVDSVIACYADKKGLTPALKPHLLNHLKSDPTGFDAMYPSVPPHQQHLLRNLSGPTASGGEAGKILARDLESGQYLYVPMASLAGANPNIAAGPTPPRPSPSASDIRTLADKKRRENPSMGLDEAIISARKDLTDVV